MVKFFSGFSGLQLLYYSLFCMYREKGRLRKNLYLIGVEKQVRNKSVKIIKKNMALEWNREVQLWKLTTKRTEREVGTILLQGSFRFL